MAKKPKDFLADFKLQKALDGYKGKFALGDKLHMFNCMYKVINSQDTGYTMLEDEKNSRFAIPTPQLHLLMKKGTCKNYGAINLEKALSGNGPHYRSGPPKYPANSPSGGAKPSGGTGTPGLKGEPVGTVHTGNDGEQYKKIADNPSQWVHIGKGTMHSDPGSQPHDDLVHPEDQAKLANVRTTLLSRTKPACHEKLKSLIMDWVESLQKHKALQAAHNTNDVDSKGKKLPRTGVARSTIENVAAHKDKAERIKKQIIDLAHENRIKKD